MQSRGCCPYPKAVEGAVEGSAGYIVFFRVTLHIDDAPHVFRWFEIQHEVVDMISVYESPMTR